MRADCPGFGTGKEVNRMSKKELKEALEKQLQLLSERSAEAKIAVGELKDLSMTMVAISQELREMSTPK